ncbi:MAG: hypothetical protein H7066_05935 [Cytophagaceae bacterium]|nr:hypothetical protein [Gemmatimonadaceae bacterium]
MALSPHLRERLLRQLDTLSDERAYQVLDYVEFVTSKYGAKEPVSTANIFTRFTDGVEDTLRAGKVSATAISETLGLLNRAAGVLSGVAAAGKSVASDIVTGVSSAAKPTTSETPATTSPPVDPNAPPPPTGAQG